jgi:MFS family permease
LAGELGGGITLVTEVLSKEMRGWGTTIVSTVGVFGAVIGGLVAQKVEWRTAYFIGGGLGLVLLVLRLSVAESGMFKQLRQGQARVSRGNFLMLFTSFGRFMKYLRCVLVGLPLWCIVGILVTFSPEISKALDIQGEIKVAQAIAFTYLGITFGGYASGHFSQNGVFSVARPVQRHVLPRHIAARLRCRLLDDFCDRRGRAVWH